MITTILVILAVLAVVYWFMRGKAPPVGNSSQPNVAQRRVATSQPSVTANSLSVTGPVGSGINDSMSGVTETVQLKQTPHSLINKLPDEMPVPDELGHRTVAEIMADPKGLKMGLTEKLEAYTDRDPSLDQPAPSISPASSWVFAERKQTGAEPSVSVNPSVTPTATTDDSIPQGFGRLYVDSNGNYVRKSVQKPVMDALGEGNEDEF